ncbi:shiftless antiviral inhibitor of ribosomal frameshifting protein homolog isoform X1 [Hypanus sabinus]|uniref:shiftless antiviral inhibitor of ribosomal frameshifting protein homolog isoform X1 n=2 Tax=Hypanus sabinus TaxID=79690 RepID=UPI0028C452B2|nr:shiftless antiviral inhibitor of ribosomal frameshifting protein homolog isoform X1 [Hypanus sabinus]
MHQNIDEVETEKSTRRLRELFHAKEIPVDKAETLMGRYDNEYDLVAEEIIRLKEQAEDADGNDPGDSEEDNVDRDLQDIVERLRTLPLTQENVRIFNLAKRNEVPRVQRQFACVCADRDWWREVPERKQVSRCRECKRRYEPVPRDQEWGIAEYNCSNCNRSFRAYGQMGLPAPCYRCRGVVLPTHIIPRMRERRSPGTSRRNQGSYNRGGYGRQNQSSCYGEDCYNREGNGGQNQRSGCAEDSYNREDNGRRNQRSCYAEDCYNRGGYGRQNRHSCCAEDCYNREEPYVPGTHCIHPETRRARGLPRNLLLCDHHVSTGSTVASCISQGSLMECDVEEIILEDLKRIPEEDGDE